jgi:hypothetical protein
MLALWCLKLLVVAKTHFCQRTFEQELLVFCGLQPNKHCLPYRQNFER